MHLSPPSAYIKDTGTPKGRGVFTGRSFVEGEIVEECPVVLFQQPFDSLPEEAKTRVFCWSALTGVPDTHALALGYGSMYNHDNPANLRCEADRERTLLRFVAARPIGQDEELTVNYNALGGGVEWHDDNWFERMSVSPVLGR
jgi:hypothetical protein